MVKLLQQYKIFPAESFHTFDPDVEAKLIQDGIAINWMEKQDKKSKIKHQDSQVPGPRNTAKEANISNRKKSNQ